MATILHEYPIPQIGAVPRSSVIPLDLPAGTQILGVIKPEGDSPRLVVRGDAALPMNERHNFVIVRGDVALTPQEAAARWVGVVTGYRTAAGLEIYHVLELSS